MSTTWDDICQSAKGWSKKVNRKVEQLSDQAATSLKLCAKRAQLAEAYEALGKLTYERMSAATEVSQDAQGADQDIARSMTDISALLAEIEALQKRSDET